MYRPIEIPLGPVRTRPAVEDGCTAAIYKSTGPVVYRTTGISFTVRHCSVTRTRTDSIKTDYADVAARLRTLKPETHDRMPDRTAGCTEAG